MDFLDTLVSIAILLGLIPAVIAHKKGYLFWLWWLYGAALFIIALPHSLSLKAASSSEKAGSENNFN